MIRAVQRAVFSLDLVKEVLQNIESDNMTKAKEIAVATLQHMDQLLLEQIKGISSFATLLAEIKTFTPLENNLSLGE